MLSQWQVKFPVSDNPVCRSGQSFSQLIYIYMMLEDMQLHPERLSWVKYAIQLLESLGFNHVWLSQGLVM